MRQLILACAIVVVLGVIAVRHGGADDAKPAEVIVLSTLHQLHEQTAAYSFQDLSFVIEQLQPDILGVELTAHDLESRRDQPVKQEYQRSVFPLLDKQPYDVISLEPPQPLYGEIVNLFREAQQQLREKNPCGAESFNLYTETLFEYLKVTTLFSETRGHA